MIRRLVWPAVLLIAALLCFVISRRVPSEDGGLVPAGLLLLALGALLLRRRTLPRSDRTV
jgi:LPXTG-motif cell wall-anchored protein